MRDRELYATIPGQEAPWTVERVEVGWGSRSRAARSGCGNDHPWPRQCGSGGTRGLRVLCAIQPSRRAGPTTSPVVAWVASSVAASSVTSPVGSGSANSIMDRSFSAPGVASTEFSSSDCRWPFPTVESYYCDADRCGRVDRKPTAAAVVWRQSLSESGSLYGQSASR